MSLTHPHLTLISLLLLPPFHFNLIHPATQALVLNNNFQGMVRQWQDLFYDQRYSQTEMVNPCFRDMAEAMGCQGLRVDNTADLPAVMEEFLKTDRPVVLDAVCEKDEHVYPMVPAGAALHEMKLSPGQTPPEM